MDSQRRTRVAVVGTGWWPTTADISALQASPHAELVALRDTDDTRLRTAAERFGVSRIYTVVATLLHQERLDGAAVVVCHAAHYAVARACLRRGLSALGYDRGHTGGASSWRRGDTRSRGSGPALPARGPSINLVDVIPGRAENQSPGEVGPRSVELLEGAYHSAAHGGHPVTIEGDKP